MLNSSTAVQGILNSWWQCWELNLQRSVVVSEKECSNSTIDIGQWYIREIGSSLSQAPNEFIVLLYIPCSRPSGSGHSSSIVSSSENTNCLVVFAFVYSG